MQSRIVSNISTTSTEKNQITLSHMTQICYYAFLRRIQKEKQVKFIKQQVLSETGISEGIFDTIDGDTSNMVNSNVEWVTRQL